MPVLLISSDGICEDFGIGASLVSTVLSLVKKVQHNDHNSVDCLVTEVLLNTWQMCYYRH